MSPAGYFNIASLGVMKQILYYTLHEHTSPSKNLSTLAPSATGSEASSSRCHVTDPKLDDRGECNVNLDSLTT